ncbi:STE3-domain-containing protein [Peniophora sp. CONT]|nr:STE3-domain-containing protein [Peniophora sp. CONT]
MAPAADPTYPLYPIACFLSSAMLLLVLLTSFIRQNWNLGVAFLCFWLFFENLTEGVNAIIWSDNADIKSYVYCDIITHMQVITFVVKPLATLIITRRLYLIASLRSVELLDTAAKRRNLTIEWTLGLVVPVLVAGPFCESYSSAAELLDHTYAWIAFPSLTLLNTSARVIRIFHRQKRDMNQFLQSNNSVSRMNYFRLFALASIDIILTLPIGIVNIVLAITDSLDQSNGHWLFYSGWTFLHTGWEPVAFSYATLATKGTKTLTQRYFVQWTSPALAFAIFGLFGVTAEARVSYWRVLCTVGGRFGWKPTPRARKARSPMGTMEFGEQQQDMSYNLDIEYVASDSPWTLLTLDE